jgi:transposase
MNAAIDEVRRTEVAELRRDGYEPILKHSRWCLLKRRENLTEPQATKLDELLKYNLKSVKAMLMREDFQQFWTYMRPSWAMRFLDSWCEQAKESGLEQMQKVAKSLQHHRRLLANWFHAKGEISSGVVESFNGKAKLTIRKAYGLRTTEGIKIALFHTLGRLPEPEGTHRFC